MLLTWRQGKTKTIPALEKGQTALMGSGDSALLIQTICARSSHIRLIQILLYFTQMTENKKITKGPKNTFYYF